MLRTAATLLSIAVLVGACSAQPVSRATTGPVASAPITAATAETPTASGAESATDMPAVTEAPATATPAPEPTKTTVPPKPGNPTWTLASQARVKATKKVLERYKATWTEPDGAATKFILYGVKGCLRASKKTDGTPCVVKGMPIPKSSLVKLGTAPGSARSIEVTLERDEVGPGPYGAILIRAANSAGNSIFTIVDSDDVCWRCTY